MSSRSPRSTGRPGQPTATGCGTSRELACVQRLGLAGQVAVPDQEADGREQLCVGEYRLEGNQGCSEVVAVMGSSWLKADTRKLGQARDPTSSLVSQHSASGDLVLGAGHAGPFSECV